METRTKVVIEKSWTGRCYTISLPEGSKISFDTFLSLGDNLSHESIAYGKTLGYKYSEETERLANDVSVSQFDYKTGEGSWTASTATDVKNWLELYKNQVYANENL